MKNISAGIFLSWEKYIKEKMKVNTKISNKGFDISGMFLFFQKISLWEIMSDGRLWEAQTAR